MDIYNTGGLPIGFTIGLAMNVNAMNHFSNMTESEKEEILNRARDAKSKEEMQEIISQLSSEKFL